MAGGGGHSGTGRDRGGPGGASKSGPDKDRRGGGGGTKKAGNATVADHMIATGGIRTPSIGPNGVSKGNYNSQDDAYNDYARAVGDYATRGTFGKIADFLGGSWFDQQEPISQNPRTFARGTYHTSSNPGGIVGGLAGGMINPALGQLTGPLGGWGYNALGGKNIFHGGYGQPDTGIYSDPSGGYNQASGGGLLGGSSPSGQQDNRGADLGLFSAGNLPPTAPLVQPQAIPGVQQTDAIKKRGYALGLTGVPGPTPYNYQTAKWL